MPPPATTERPRRGAALERVALVVLAVVIVGFARSGSGRCSSPRRSVNKIDDRAWADAGRGDLRRRQRPTRRRSPTSADRRRRTTAAMLAERADIVDRATDIVEQMLDDVVAVAADRRQGPGARAAVGGRLPHVPRRPPRVRRRRCAPGTNEPFAETAVDGIPISEKLSRFAGDNDMPDCAPPLDRHELTGAVRGRHRSLTSAGA